MDINSVVEQIASLPYFERRVVISRKIKPNSPRFIYKYRTISPKDNKSIDRLRDILVRSKLWLSSPLDFNDPFDMSAKFQITNNAKSKRERLSQLAKGQRVKRKDRKKFVRKMMLLPHDELETRYSAIFEDNINKTGVFSFAGDPRNILMWSHYANNHFGICIQYEVARDLKVLSQAIPVNYSTEYPIIDWINNFQNSISDAILRKHEGWKYEKETRIVLPGKARNYIAFNTEAITGIIFGCKTTSEIKNTVIEILQERARIGLSPIKLYQAFKHNNQYKLNIFSN